MCPECARCSHGRLMVTETAAFLPADIQHRDGAQDGCHVAAPVGPRRQPIWADGGATGPLADWINRTYRWRLVIVRKLVGQFTFVVRPRRWVVMRTFGWLRRYRRLSKDFEEAPERSEASVYVAAIHLILRRLTPT